MKTQKSGHENLLTASIIANIMTLMILKFTLKKLKILHQRQKLIFAENGLILSSTIIDTFKIKINYCISISCIGILKNWILTFLELKRIQPTYIIDFSDQ